MNQVTVNSALSDEVKAVMRLFIIKQESGENILTLRRHSYPGLIVLGVQ